MKQNRLFWGPRSRDTSFLHSLILVDTHTPNARASLQEIRRPEGLALSPFHQYELPNAVRLTLWSLWLEAIDVPKDGETYENDMTFAPMLDAADEFQAATFNALHGFYRQSIGRARNALEFVTVAIHSLESQIEIFLVTRFLKISRGHRLFRVSIHHHQ